MKDNLAQKASGGLPTGLALVMAPFVAGLNLYYNIVDGIGRRYKARQERRNNSGADYEHETSFGGRK